MSSSYWKSKYFRLILIVFTMSTLLFILMLQNVMHQSDIPPNEKDYKSVTFTTLYKQLNNNKISTLYYTKEAQNVYIVTKDNKYEKVINLDTDEFVKKMTNSKAVMKSTNELQFGKEVVTNRLGLYSFFLVCCYVWCIAYFCNSYNEYQTKGTITVIPSKNKRKKLTTVGASSENVSDIKTNYDDSVKTFDDIAGLTEVKKDMKCLVDFLVNKEKYSKAGAKLPKGVILYGPPGTGKTLLAKAVANEAKVPFMYMSGSEFIEMYVGVGAKRVRELFEKARKTAPCIIFIDEIDAIGGKRTDKDNGEDRKTINALLTEMDGFKESDNIIVIAATNRIEDLDQALLRPGRFTDKFCVPLPETADERYEVLKVYTRNKKLAEDVDLHALAKETVGFSPAKLEALMNESAIISVQKNRDYIIKQDIEDAMFKQLLSGHAKENQEKRKKEELELVAWHEAGHALVGRLFGKEVTKVTVVASTSGAGGVTFSTPKTGLLSKEDIQHEIMQLYAGRIGELIFYNNDRNKITTGASNDIKEATKLLHAYVTDYAMHDDLGMINLGLDSKVVKETEMNLAKELEEKTINLVEEHSRQLKLLADMLLEKETLYESDLDEILKN